MKPKIPVRKLREHPDLDQLKRQAKELLEAFRAGKPDAVAEINANYRRPDAATFALHDAQLTLARAYGFDSWPKLKAHVDGVTVQRLAQFAAANDIAQVRAMLKVRPELANMQLSYGNEHRPLHFAVMSRRTEMVRLLMQHGADAHAGIHPHRDATAALTLAEERGFDDIVAIIHEEDGRHTAPDDDDDSVATAVEEVRPFDKLSRAAVASGDANWLRARHADGTLTNPIEWGSGGLLTEAVRHNHPEILELLLGFGFDPDERVGSVEGDGVHYSQAFPLWECAAKGKREMAEILLRHGADPNAHVDSSGSSVYSAYSHRQPDMVELLRSHGGAVTADIAGIYRQTGVARQLLAGDPGPAVVQELLRFASDGGDPEIVRMALERIDWPRDDPRWFGPLVQPLSFWNHIPWLYAGNKEFDRGTYIQGFRLILQRCDPSVIGGFGRTALHEVGAMRDHITEEEAEPFAIALLAAGARTDLRDEILKSTPLGWACRWGRLSIVKALLDHGADPVEPDAEPWARPRAWAEKMGHTAIAKLLARLS